MPATKNTDATPTPETPRAVKRVTALGIPVSLAAAAAVSFAGLTDLGRDAGIAHPWLMPVAIDVYAATATLTAMLLPDTHPGRRAALWHARLGLAMSMGGNALARYLHLGAAGYTPSGMLLTLVGAWPSLIVERLLQLQGRLSAPGSGSPAPRRRTPTAGAAAAAGSRAPGTRHWHPATGAPALPPPSGIGTPGTAAPAAAPPPAMPPRNAARQPGNVVQLKTPGRLSPDQWAQLALPLWTRHADTTGAAPTAKQLAAALRDAHPHLTVPASDRAERNIRAATAPLAAKPQSA